MMHHPWIWIRRMGLGLVFLLAVLFVTAPFSFAASGFGPGKYKSGYTYGNGIFFAPHAFNIYAEPNEQAKVVESIRWGNQGTVLSDLSQTPKHSGNLFFCFYPELEVAMMAVVGDTDTGWAEVIYDQGRDKTGWVKVRAPQAPVEEAASDEVRANPFAPPMEASEATEAAPAHLGMYQTWVDFMKLNAKAHGIYWLTGVSQYNRSIRMSDDDKAKLIPLTIVRDLKVKHLRGNWLLVEVLDFERNTPIGWVRWRDNDGNLMVFPNFTGNKGPIVTTVY